MMSKSPSDASDTKRLPARVVVVTDVRLLRDADLQSEAETGVDPRWLALLKLRDDLDK